MGLRYGKGLPNRVHKRPLPEDETAPTTVWGGAHGANEGGADRATAKGGGRTDRTSQGRFLLNPVTSAEKKRQTTPRINLKALNQYVQTYHFKIEGLQTLKDLIKPGDWLAMVDLKDAYFVISIDPSYRKYLRFVVDNQTYQFNCLPFGLAAAPWVFTKTLKPVAATLCQMGVRLICYIDDILLLAETQTVAEEQVKGLQYLLECLGFIVHPDKPIMTPGQVMEFLGMSVDSTKMELRLPAKKLKDIRAEARKLAQQREISVRALSRLVGKMNAASHTIPPAPLFFRNLQMAMTEALNASNQNYEVEVTLSQDCLDELRWWDYHLSQWNGKSMLRKAVDLVIESDASLAGWGAVCNHQQTGGP